MAGASNYRYNGRRCNYARHLEVDGTGSKDGKADVSEGCLSRRCRACLAKGAADYVNVERQGGDPDIEQYERLGGVARSEAADCFVVVHSYLGRDNTATGEHS